MNDFTKEELQIILLDMHTYIIKTPLLKESPTHKDLRNKVEEMIDNYCEHHDKGEVDIFVDICGKCNAYMLREMYHE